MHDIVYRELGLQTQTEDPSDHRSSEVLACLQVLQNHQWDNSVGTNPSNHETHILWGEMNKVCKDMTETMFWLCVVLGGCSAQNEKVIEEDVGSQSQQDTNTLSLCQIWTWEIWAPTSDWTPELHMAYDDRYGYYDGDGWFYRKSGTTPVYFKELYEQYHSGSDTVTGRVFEVRSVGFDANETHTIPLQCRGQVETLTHWVPPGFENDSRDARLDMARDHDLIMYVNHKMSRFMSLCDRHPYFVVSSVLCREEQTFVDGWRAWYT
jgi:hypothetical protein